MAEEPIRKEDIIDIEGVTKGLLETISLLEKLSSVLGKDIFEAATRSATAIEKFNVSTKEGQELMKQEMISVNETVEKKKELTKLDNEIINLKAKIKDTWKDQAIEVERLKKALKENNEENKRLVAIEGSAKDSVNVMKAKLRELVLEYNKLSSSARDKAAPAIKKLEDEIKKADDLIGRHQRNVGNYANSISGLGNRLVDTSKEMKGLNAVVTNGAGQVLNAIGGMISFASAATAVTVVMTKLKEAFAATVSGMDALNIAGAITKQMFYDLIKTGQINQENLANAAKAQDMLNKVRAKDRNDMIEYAKREREIAKLEYDAADKTKTHAERREILNKAIEKQNELSDLRIKDAYKELDAVELLLQKQPDNEDLLNRKYALGEKIIKLDQERYNQSKWNESRITQFEQEETDERKAMFERYYAEIDKSREENERKEKESIDRIAKYDEFVKNKKDKDRADREKQGEEEIKRLADNFEKNKKNEDTAFAHAIEIAKIKDEALKQDAQREWDRMQERDEKEKESAEIRKQEWDDSLRTISGSLNAFSDLFEAAKQRELSAAGDNAEKREAIERKFAKKQQLLSEGQALINGAMAITEIWRKWAAHPVIAGIFTAITAAQTVAQVAVIRAQKFAKGGSGILDGAVHASGGIQIPGIGEAESGEHFSIASRRATSKYGAKMLDAVSSSINQGKFFEVWSNANKVMNNGDPYTRKMYELMVKTPTVYPDSVGNTVKEYPNGKKIVIKRISLN